MIVLLQSIGWKRHFFIWRQRFFFLLDSTKSSTGKPWLLDSAGTSLLLLLLFIFWLRQLVNNSLYKQYLSQLWRYKDRHDPSLIISIFQQPPKKCLASLPKCGKFVRDMVLWICHFPSFFKQCLTSLFAPKCSKFDRDLAEMWEMDLPFLLIPLALSPCWSAQHWWASRSNLSAFKWLISVECVFYCILRFL